MEKQFCPHLGTEDGFDSHFGYPSRGNRCWRSGTHSQVTLDHQETFCLGENHTSCPIYLQEPDRIRVAHEAALSLAPRRTRWSLAIALITLAGIALLIIGLLFTDLLPYNAGTRFREMVSGIQLPALKLPASDPVQDETSTPVSASDQAPGSTVLPTETLPATPSAYPPPQITLPDQFYVTTDQSKQGPVDYAEANVRLHRPDSYQVQIQGENIQIEPVYSLPDLEGFSILLDGHTISLSENEPRTFTQTGPGYSVQIEGVIVRANRQDTINVSPQGDHLEYTPGEDNQVNIFIRLESGEGYLRIAIQELELDEDRTFVLAIDRQVSQINLHNNGFVVGDYNLLILDASTGEQSRFLSPGIAIDSLQSQQLDFSTMNTTGVVSLSLDDRADGEFDQVLELENQLNLYYVPFIVK
jgi:hypothetical protein